MVVRLTAMATAFPLPPLPQRNAEMAAPGPSPGTAIHQKLHQNHHGGCVCPAAMTRTQ
jgi:hypothetical protein